MTQKGLVYPCKAKKAFRFISIICIIILITSNCIKLLSRNFLSSDGKLIPQEFFVFIQNWIFCLFFIIIAVHPEKIGFIAIMAFLYTAYITFFEPDNQMGLLMLFLGTSTLFMRGLMKNKRKQKIIMINICYLILCVTEIRFGTTVFIQSILEKIAYSVVSFIIFYFIKSYYITNLLTEQEKILAVHKYEGLTPRDALWLKRIQQGDAYKVIAIDEHMNIGSVKNRFKIIYQTLGVDDRQGFMTIYGDCNILYTKNI